MNKLHQYWNELQRRHVVKAGLAYLVGAWLLVQVLDILLDAFQLGPGWMQTTIIALSVGFPIWLIIAWVYDFSPEGIKKTEDVPFDSKVAAKKNLQLNRLIIGGLSIAVILLIVNQVRMSSTPDPQPAMASMLPDFTSSIAVLAFEDISPDQNQEWLSDGISIQILDHLNKYKDLKIISHRSSFAYKNKDISIDIIGEELGVKYILDGSIQKVGDMFRATVQLIDTKDGSQIWSANFDRNLEDALEVQDEIASKIAERLNLTLFNEDVRLRKVDPEAFELYLKGLHEFEFLRDSTMNLADSLIHLSLEIDSEYAPAWTLLSGITFHNSFYYGHIDKKTGIRRGLEAAKRAIALDSTRPGAVNWLSNWQWHARDGNASLQTLEELLEEFPNSAAPHSYASHALTRMGMPRKALQNAYIGKELDPENGDILLSIAFLENYLETYEKAIPAFEEYLDYRQQVAGSINGDGAEILAHIYYKKGDLKTALEVLKMEPSRYWRLVTQIMIQYGEESTLEGDRLLEELKSLPKEEIPAVPWANLDFELARLYTVKGDLDTAFSHLDKANEFLMVFTEFLWYYPEFKKLHKDPRWKQLLDRLGEEFNFDYNSEG